MQHDGPGFAGGQALGLEYLMVRRRIDRDILWIVMAGSGFVCYLAINLAWGIAVTLGCYVAGGVSGAHMNPAVTLAVAVHRGFPWRKVPAYVVAQMAGAFAGAAWKFFSVRSRMVGISWSSAIASVVPAVRS